MGPTNTTGREEEEEEEEAEEAELEAAGGAEAEGSSVTFAAKDAKSPSVWVLAWSCNLGPRDNELSQRARDGKVAACSPFLPPFLLFQAVIHSPSRPIFVAAPSSSP